jgi:hypothetical protein
MLLEIRLGNLKLSQSGWTNGRYATRGRIKHDLETHAIFIPSYYDVASTILVRIFLWVFFFGTRCLENLFFHAIFFFFTEGQCLCASYDVLKRAMCDGYLVFGITIQSQIYPAGWGSGDRES